MLNYTLEIDHLTYQADQNIKDKFDDIIFHISKLLEIKKDLFFECFIVNETEIQRLNKEFRQNDKVTDVVSFALWDSGIKTNLIGEIYICYEKAMSQSKEYGHSFEREICFLFAHGILHLLQYNHISKADEKIMFGIQDKVLSLANIER